MSDLTVADELAFDALDEATRALCNKVVAAAVEVSEAAASDAYDDGYKAGRKALSEEFEEYERESVKLRGQMKALEDQLTHAGLKPNRQYGVPATTPPLDASLFEAKPKQGPSTGEAAD